MRLGDYSGSMKPGMGGRRKPVVITVVVVVVLWIITVYSVSKSKAALATDNFNGLFSSIFSENDKKQDEFLKRLEKLQSKFFSEQERRLAKLESQNELLIEQLQVLRVPPNTMNVRDKLSFLIPYNPRAKFPGYIWQSWKHGLNDDKFDATYKEGQAQWAFKNPGFVHELFNDDTSHAIIKHLFGNVPEIVEAYESLPEVILRMDFFRYLILFAKGGVYADVDTFPLQPVPNWISENVSPTELGVILAVGSDSSSANWRNENTRRLEFGQFIIQAKPGHPVLREVIAKITEMTLKAKKALKEGERLALSGNPNQRQLDISRWTGSGIWTDVIMEYFNDYLRSSIYQTVTWTDFHGLEQPKLVSDILVLPAASFASSLEVPKDGKITDSLAYAKHWSAKLWKGS